MGYLLGIDIGTSGTKTLICDEAGVVKATAMTEHDVMSPKPGWSEQDPDQWWNATCSAVKKVVGKAGIAGRDVSAIGLSGQMHGSVFMGGGDSFDAPLRPALLWNDQRTAAECIEIEKRAGSRKKLIDMVGNPALTGFTAPKILWVQQHEPQVFEQTKHILLPKDFIRYRMTDHLATDVGDASGTLLLNVKKRKWHKDLVRLLDIDPAMLPKVYESHEVTGKLTARAAEALGLAAGTPVVGGSGDQPAGAVGNGIVASGIVSATLGTSGVVFAHADKPTYDPKGRVHTMCSAVAGKWCVFGCMLSAGGSYQWFRNTMAALEIEKAKAKGCDPYQLLDAKAAEAPAGCEGLMFLPYLTGERCPHADPLARGGWIGLTARTDRAMMIRAVLEGVTFGMTDALRIIQKMDIPVETIRLSGGGGKSPLWRQMQADIYNTPVATINSDEGPAYGVALLAGVGTGVWSSVPEACESAIHETLRVEPDAAMAKFYNKKVYKLYRRLYPLLKGEFGAMADIAEKMPKVG